jgi:beta-lactamase class D
VLNVIAIAALLGLVMSAPSAARQTKTAHGSCVVIHDLTAAKPHLVRGECSTRLSPASTFKIPHALVALETGVVKADSVERWDGTKYERQPKWNLDHTVISALRPSVLWLFQRIAPRIGAARMTEWLTKFDYGNRDTSGPIDAYWTNGRLRVSPLEQVEFLRRFYRGQLPVTAPHVRAVRDGLEQKPGTVENSLGVHRLEGDWRNATLNSKTGATSTSEHRVSWLVGLLGSAGREYAFAAATWRVDGAVDTLDGARLATRTFMDVRLIP